MKKRLKKYEVFWRAYHMASVMAISPRSAIAKASKIPKEETYQCVEMYYLHQKKEKKNVKKRFTRNARKGRSR